MSKKRTPTTESSPAPAASAATTPLRLEWIEAGSLTPNPSNWRRHPDPQVAALKDVINDPAVGWAGALLLNQRTGRLIDGHARREIVSPETPVPVLIGSWSEEAEKRILATLDPIAGMALPDPEALSLLLQTVDLDTEGMKAVEEALRADLQALDVEQHGGAIIEDRVPEPPKIAITQPGDLLIMDGHRLLCGDSTKPEDVKRVMDGQRATLFATDPPYLVDYDGTNHPHKWNERNKNKDWSKTYGVEWDDAKANPELFDKFIGVAIAEAILPNAAWYCWHASRRQAMLEAVWEKHGGFVHQQIIWCKDRPILTRSWFLWQHEPCFMGWIKGNKPPRTAEDNPRSVWQIATVPAGQETEHPTSKPVELFAVPMRQHTLPGEVCYEPFAGSGSQIIAAEQLGRRCFAIEISPQYVDVCVNRWEALTGKKAVRQSGTASPEKTPATTGVKKVKV